MNQAKVNCLHNPSFSSVLALIPAALLVVSLLPPLVHAQTPVVPAKSCTIPQMARLISEQGNGVQVDANREMTGRVAGQAENEKGIVAAGNLASDRDLRKARALFEKGARKGFAPAEVNLAVAYLAGWGGATNPGTALYWLQEAAHQDFPAAHFDLGILYMQGCGVAQNYQQAARYFEQGAQLNHAAAQMNLGYLYDRGLGVPQDRAIAASWYRKAADNNDPSAQYNLADLYLNGQGVTQSDVEAFRLFQKSAAQGHTAAQIMLGNMYSAGRGTPRNLQAAYQWLSTASLNGDQRGSVTLKSIEKQLAPEQIAAARHQAQMLASAKSQPGELAQLQ